jgi:predicted metalloprotease with PDZ domain
MAARTRYRVSIPAPHTHLIAVEARWEELGGEGPLDLHMATWTPGSYLVREYSRHVQDVACEDGEGRRLPVSKTAKNVWRVERGNARTLVARYAVYAHELTVRTNHVDDSHAFWNGAATYLWLEERRHESIELAVEAPSRWAVATALEEVAGTAGVFRARDLDELIDSPVECGRHALYELTAAGRRHRLAVWGRPDGTLGYDPQALTRDVGAIVETHAAMFGGVPYEHYLFILHLAMNAYGGLEHRASATLLASPATFHPRKKYEEFLELVSHEFFHLWNVKRIRPRALGPFDYDRV